MPFEDRRDAGRRLGRRLAEMSLPRPSVFGVARGGVVVAAEVAAALSCPLEVLAPRKLPSPYSDEVAIGAVTEDGAMVLDERAVAMFSVTEEYLARVAAKARNEVSRRLKEYRGGRPPLDPCGRDAVVVDDGIATGYTLLAAIKGLRRAKPCSLVLAVPVAPADSLARLRREVDVAVCLETPTPFYAVGQAYADFAQVSDEEVVCLLRSHCPDRAAGEQENRESGCRPPD